MKEQSLSTIIQKFFSDESEKKHAKVDLKDQWVMFGKFGFLSSWYPRPVEFAETDTYLFFDRRKANIFKAAVYGVASFLIVSGFTFVFFGYFSLLFLAFSFLMGLLFFGLFYAAARSISFGVMAVPKSWISGVEEKQGWIVVKGRKSVSGCKSAICSLESWQSGDISPLEQLWHALDIDPLYDTVGDGRFEIRYRAARMRKTSDRSSNETQNQAPKRRVA